MEKSLQKQLTMCDMIPDVLSQTNTCKNVEKSSDNCVTNSICAALEKPAKDLYSFVQWQKHNKELLSRSIEGHHHSNV